MAMEVSGTDQHMRFTLWDWRYLLALAAEYGWEPKGTIPPDRWRDAESWEGGYCTNDFQWVTPEDALYLADGLERALPRIPQDDALLKHLRIDPVFGAMIEATPAGEHFLPVEWFSGPNRRQILLEFIRLCRGGGFVIS